MTLRQRIEQRITDLRMERDIAAAATPSRWYAEGEDEGYYDVAATYTIGMRFLRADATHISAQDPATVIARIDRELAGCAADLALLDAARDSERDTATEAAIALRARYPKEDA
jgi:hypothetical protein